MIVVPGRTHALMMTSNVWAERSATGVDSHLTPTKSHAVTRNWLELHFCWSIYSIFPQYYHPWQPPLKKSVKNKSKLSSTLVCSTTVTSQHQFRVQNGVPNEIGGSENGGLLGTWAQTVTESHRKDKRHPPPMVGSVGKKTTFFVTGSTGWPTLHMIGGLSRIGSR